MDALRNGGRLIAGPGHVLCDGPASHAMNFTYPVFDEAGEIVARATATVTACRTATTATATVTA